jgi:hypothetical protein
MALTDIFKGETWGVIRAKLNEAIGQVNTHSTTIAEVDTKADTATADASTALSAAQTADTKAGTALTNAAAADAKAQTAADGLAGKVDKVTGKGLSSEDYTTTEKTKLDGIAANANNYTHPVSHPISVIEGLSTQLATIDGKATAADTKAQSVVDALPMTYKAVTVATYALALGEAIGIENKIIDVVADEDKGQPYTTYRYIASAGVLKWVAEIVDRAL